MTWSNLIRQPFRTALTALGAASGVVAIVALGSVVRGFYTTIETGIHNSNSDLVIYQAGTAMDFLSTLDEENTRAQLRADPDVVATASGQSNFLTMDGKIGSMIIAIGIHPDEYAMKEQGVVKGRIIQSGDEVIIGSNLEHRSSKTVGDSIIFGDRTFTICGIAHTGNVLFDGAVVMDIKILQAMMGRQGTVTCLYVKLKPGTDAYQVAERIERQHPHLAAIAGAEQYKKVDQSLEYADSMIWAVSFLALSIGSLIIANTMWMSVHHRTREIGVLRAVGWSRRRVMTLIVTEAAGIGMIACLLGSLLGIGLAKLAAILPFSDQFVDPVFPARTFFLAFGVATALSIVGAIVPAVRAANISPAEALRYE